MSSSEQVNIDEEIVRERNERPFLFSVTGQKLTGRMGNYFTEE